ncbi:uncharacterized protein LOC118761405 isoform X1 [Octopus sinensis]|uniref:Uncharacterized protein LOC118761405 isoform X1 n=1 Tax=Octopus sinensis TaxID=2607531 RepID=A0A7E6EHT4_9MOLL|nr:uncharacterized protein LOC118761405 isoform X1 [Octopus sinensis]
MALSDLLDSLAKPNPTFHDGDDDFGDNTTAQLSVHGTEDDAKDGDQIQKSTKLKRQAASLLSDTDTRYAGHKTTRKDLMQDSGKCAGVAVCINNRVSSFWTYLVVVA